MVKFIVRTVVACAACGGLAGPAARAADKGARAAGGDFGGGASPWPAGVPGFVAPAPGEHPRLLFRKADLPALKARAATPEGRAILKRLRATLDGADGDTFPKVFNASGKAYAGNKAGGEDEANSKGGSNPSVKNQGKNAELPLGAYTIGHAAGYGLLYQLTGDRKYADLGRQAFEKAFAGVRDRDDRYSFRAPGGALRAGPALGAYALGYDLCYDGWEPAFRRKVAEAFTAYDEGPDMSLESCALGKRQHPGSNHWGSEIGGPAMVLLAIKGDPGAADDAKVDRLLKGSADCFVRNMTEGFSEYGFFPEGDGAATISSDTCFTTALRCWRVAGGKDFIAPRPNAQWLTMKWVMLTIPLEGGKWLFPTRGAYDHNVFARTGMSGSGTFGQGFGAVTDEEKPALLWLYNHLFKAADDAAGAPFDTVNPYPHRAVQAFVNWPLGMAEQNPATVLPRAVEDKRRAYYMFRNQWAGPGDVVVTALLRGAKGNYAVKGGEIIVLAGGKKTTFPVSVTGDPKYFEATATGGVVSTSAGSFGVDFSKASGADALLVLAGPVTGGGGGKAKGNVRTVTAGGTTFTIMAVGGEPAPDARADGDKVVVGNQTVGYDGTKVVFGK